MKRWMKIGPRIARRIGVSEKLPHQNKSAKGGGYRDFYSEKSRKIVGDYYQKDVELLKYEF